MVLGEPLWRRAGYLVSLGLMRKSVALTMLIAGIAASGATGFWFGVREGMSLGLMTDAAPRGVLAAGMLSQLNTGKTEDVAPLLDFDVDKGLIWSHQLSESSLGPLLKPLWGYDAFPSNTEYVVRLANFRKRNPSPQKIDAFDTVSPEKEQYREFYRDLASGARENARIISEMVAKYSSPQ